MVRENIINQSIKITGKTYLFSLAIFSWFKRSSMKTDSSSLVLPILRWSLGLSARWFTMCNINPQPVVHSIQIYSRL